MKIAGRYEIGKQLGKGGMGEVYSATDLLTDRRVALKVVTLEQSLEPWPGVALPHDVPESHTAFARALTSEFSTLAALRHPNIIDVLDYGFDAQKRPFFTMELLDHAQPVTALAESLSVNDRLLVLVDIVQGLAYLHRHEIIHRDLKPGNVLVSDRLVKVLDFGLAVYREGLPPEDSELAGTYEYMAPELLSGGAASYASDLYAFGTIAYQLLAGRHPFYSPNLARLLHETATKLPDVESLALDERLAALLHALLAKDPYARPKTAMEVIRALAEITGNDASVEPVTIRESYLKSAALVGRDRELKQLRQALDQALDGHGSAWLMAGESGVGKSRLMAELRIYALVSGALVLQGQALNNGNAPYQLWRDIIRRLIIQTDLTPLEASALKRIIPDVEYLTKMTVLDPQPLDPQSEQTRLITTIHALIYKQTEPVVILLEDVQWSDQDLVVLRGLQEHMTDAKLLIIASYRDDERPDLRATFPTLQFLQLSRFDKADIDQLSRFILGVDSVRIDLTEFLYHETEGNTFFVLEVLRELANASGLLANIKDMALPKSIMASGIQAVIDNRLKRVPEKSYPLLVITAVAGRYLDLDLLQCLAPEVDLSNWLISVAAVIDTENDVYRFSHDKFREGILNTLPANQRRDLHRRVAQGLETLYSTDPTHYALLYYHWAQAGDLTKELTYAGLAGEVALRNNAYQDAVRLLTRAVELQATEPDKLRQGKLFSLLGEAYLGNGRIGQARQFMEQACTAYGWPTSTVKSSLNLTVDTSRLLAQHILFSTGISRRRVSGLERQAVLDALSFNNSLIRIYLNTGTKFSIFINHAIRAANWADQLHDPNYKMLTRASLGAMFSYANSRPMADLYFGHAASVINQVSSPIAKITLFRARGMYLSAQGDWTKSFADLRQAADIAESIGGWRLAEEIYLVLAGSYIYINQFAESDAFRDRLYAIAQRINDRQALNWVMLARLLNYVLFGQDEQIRQESAAEIRTARAALDPDDLNSLLTLARTELVYLWYSGQRDECLKKLEEVLQFGEKFNFPGFVVLTSYDMIARICFDLWQATSYTAPDLQQFTLRAIKLLGLLKRFPISQPAYDLYTGLYAHVTGQTETAQRLWQRSLNAAQKYKMAYYEGRAAQQLGLHSADPRQKQQYLAVAQTIFDRLGIHKEDRASVPPS